MRYIYELLEKTGLPKGVVKSGQRRKSRGRWPFSTHPKIRAISLRGFKPQSQSMFTRALPPTANARQCQGGAKNHVIVLPDADMPMATQIISEQCIRLRRPALPRRLGRDNNRRSAKKTFRDSIAGRRLET